MLRVVSVGCVDDGDQADVSGLESRWEPDEFVVAEVLASPRSFLQLTRMPAADRAWLVAGLSVAGMGAEEIAARTGCSLRLVRTVRSWEMTQVCRWVLSRTAGLEGELSAERSAHGLSRQQLADSRREADRLRSQVDQLVALLGKGVAARRCPGGHVMAGMNVYRHGGRSYCRECKRIREAQRRRDLRDGNRVTTLSGVVS